MAKTLKWVNESVRENRILMEIIVDCYEEDEELLAWRAYMENYLKFPFQAKWKSQTI